MTKKKKKKKLAKIEIILAVLIVICSGLFISSLLYQNKLVAPEFAPSEIDKIATEEKNDDKKMDKKEGGGAVSLSYSDNITIDINKKIVGLYFKNPSKSRENIMLQLILNKNNKEILLAQSDLLPAGYVIRKMDLKDNAILQAGKYKGILRVTYYNEETSVKQIVNTEIKVNIEVK